MQVKGKIVTAYEEVTSLTLRITPSDIGRELLFNSNDADYLEILESLRDNLILFRKSGDKASARLKALNTYIEELEDGT